ncbi:ead/Ea22-like family protein [Escherichia coli]|nr:ead/Ea22-like family protein [Escherichia coli]EFA4466179.1 ead/Ea22-like family protein [Escherichia coli]EFB1656120.1 ead/Ea22-like family protein [Escherichia coli]EFB1717668.1 ead/Ea22-like family protein [Escherichia coli]EFB2407158.1 ead/Ea22-like family protein [Escherichia coli]EFB2411549.1 ead/Ea22-like family protein [Escherichia coli]
MNKIDYHALHEKAEKATSGVWSLEYGESRFDGDDALIHREVAGYIPICRIEGAHPESGFDEDFQMEQQANAEFIAAANPATVLALLDELERKQQYIKDGEWPIDNGTIEVYAAPPVPVVPAALPENDDEDGHDIDYLEPSEVYALGRTAGWNACRAAMLKGDKS